MSKLLWHWVGHEWAAALKEHKPQKNCEEDPGTNNRRDSRKKTIALFLDNMFKYI